VRGEPRGDFGYPTPVHHRHRRNRCGGLSCWPDRLRRCCRGSLHRPRERPSHHRRFCRRPWQPQWLRRRQDRFRRWRFGRRRDRWRRRRQGRRRRDGLRRRFRWGRCRFRRSGRHRCRLLEHQLDRRLIWRGRKQRWRHDHKQGADHDGVQKERCQSPPEMSVSSDGQRRAAVSWRTDGRGWSCIRQAVRATPFWNVITYRHQRLLSSLPWFGKNRPPFRLGTNSGTIAP
jgi:hypothetical protein